ncbi:nucleotidyl transferase AbiEii/AbiGii toxin family protein [Nocardiopsis algeriensis]|uniref:nucleotidyl transferase AbiEii/AbiGii toxin family protein n=1 Tax=Nocardiopsis algeriensis TaxID=1478215 RepID=UPI003B428CAC
MTETTPSGPRPLYEFSGRFEVHLTLEEAGPERAAEAALWAEEHGLKFTHIELDRGSTPSQPMVTYHTGESTLSAELETADRWAERLAAAGFGVTRTKLEVKRESPGVPRTDEEARKLPPWCYFESHLKLLLPGGADLDALSALVEPHGARLSRNARRTRDDGRQERFVTQRCFSVGRYQAYARTDDLFRTLQLAGVLMDRRHRGPRPTVLEAEYEFVVHDSALTADSGWMDAPSAPALENRRDRHPDTYLPNTTGDGAVQGKVFDPALKHLDYAYRAGDPVFTDPAAGARWWEANRRAMDLALSAIANTPWRDSLVLRGSMLMPVWVGEAARRPRDLDFVVVPADTPAFGDPADRMLGDIAAALTDRDGIGFGHGDVRQEEIWTYERASGRRLLVPWRAEGVPPGTVQIDVVFGEPLPEPPVEVSVGGARVLAASAELSLAWKVLWLYTDAYPQGKDLYDAVLLAENSSLPAGLLREVLRTGMGPEADTADERHLRDGSGPGPEEWNAFTAECPWVEGGAGEWLDRFEAAMAPVFAEG